MKKTWERMNAYPDRMPVQTEFRFLLLPKESECSNSSLMPMLGFVNLFLVKEMIFANGKRNLPESLSSWLIID